jgi:hypothetical protein
MIRRIPRMGIREARPRGIMVVESVGPALGKRTGKEARRMLFVTLLSTRPGNTLQEGVARRLQ